MSLDKDPYSLYDTLANEDDLNALYEVLCSVKDKNGRNAVITADTHVANPDFEKIKASGYTQYHFEPFTETLKRSKKQKTLLLYGAYSNAEEQKKWGETGEKNGVTYRYVAQRVIEGYWQRRFDIYIGGQLNERKLIKSVIKSIDTDTDIVWTDSSMFGFKVANKLKRIRTNSLLFLEMSEFLDIHLYNKGNLLQNRKGDKRKRFFDNKAFYDYDAIALMTNTLMAYYRNFPKGKAKFLHLPMTVDLDRFRNDVETLPEFKQPYIAFVGVMNDAKDGVNILLQAFLKITDEFPEVNLNLVGGWNYDTPAHEAFIKEKNLENRIFWRGEYTRDKIPAIIKNAELLVLPRPDSKQAQGGFPTKLGEYLATGNPVCATTVGELPHYLKDKESVYFAEPGSVESFEKVLREALSHPEKSKEIGENGRKVAEKFFNKEIQAKALHEFLEKLVNEEPGAKKEVKSKII